jgi:hypothetical protein
MMQKSTTFTTILRVKNCHFHYDMQKIDLDNFRVKIKYCIIIKAAKNKEFFTSISKSHLNKKNCR